MVILTGGLKGGIGKSTVCTSLACYLSQIHDVVIVDCDKQKSSSDWCADRMKAGLPEIKVVQLYENIAKDLHQLNKEHEIIMVDVAGKDSVELRTTAAIADVMIIPCLASYLDVKTFLDLAPILEDIRCINPNLKTYALINKASTNIFSKEAEDAADYIRCIPNLELLRNRLCERKIFRDVMYQGRGVVEAAEENEKAANEVIDVAHEIFDLLNIKL